MNHEDTKSRLLRTMLRQGRWMKEGELAGYIRLTICDPEFEVSLSQMAEAGLVSVSPTGHGRARKVELTKDGRKEATLLKAERNKQTAEAALSKD
jgi:DNA-binding MarR family transcriptional regulator